MDDQKPTIISRFSLTETSGRRKAALLVMAMMVGALITEPDFLGDVTATNDGSLNTDRDQIGEILGQFDGNLVTPESADNNVVANSEQDNKIKAGALVIPDSDSPANVQSVSYPGQLGNRNSPVGHSTSSTSQNITRRTSNTVPPRASHNHQAETVDRTPSIRLTGTIYRLH